MPKARNKNTRVLRSNKLKLWERHSRRGDLLIAHTTLALCEKMGWLEDHPVAIMAKEILKKYGKAKTLANEERLEPTQYKRLSREELEKFFGKAKELTQYGLAEKAEIEKDFALREIKIMQTASYRQVKNTSNYQDLEQNSVDIKTD